MKFVFTSAPAYLLYVLLVTAFAFIRGATFDAYGTALFGALVWYTSRRAYKEVKLTGMTMTRDEAPKDEDK